MRSILVLALLIAFIIFSLSGNESIEKESPNYEAGEVKSKIATNQIEDEIQTSVAKTKSKMAKKSEKTNWDTFSENYGSNLEPNYHKNGKVVSIRGEFGKGLPAGYDFNPMIRGQVERRANEIMDSLKEISMLPEGSELSIPTIRTGPVSAQVFYKQKYGGYPVYPVGDIKVDIGPKGELLGFYSDYQPDINVTNGFTIDHASAERKIRDMGYINDRPGRRIIWSSGNEARSAYEFYAEGKQIIVDADSSDILITRDRRIF